MIIPVLAMFAAIADPPPFNEGTDRGVFVYGPVVLDFRSGREVSGRLHDLRNCSTQTQYCADGDVFNIVIPRFCADLDLRVGSRWRQGSLETTVIGREELPLNPHTVPEPGQPDYVYYLSTNERPDVVLGYSPIRGVHVIFHDWRRAVDFEELARRGRLQAFMTESVSVPGRENLILYLITFDQFGGCLTEEFRRAFD